MKDTLSRPDGAGSTIADALKKDGCHTDVLGYGCCSKIRRLRVAFLQKENLVGDFYIPFVGTYLYLVKSVPKVYFYTMSSNSLLHLLTDAVNQDSRSDKALSLSVSESPRLIKRLRSGTLPSGRLLEKLCSELGIEFRMREMSRPKPAFEVDWYGYISAGGGSDPLDSQAMISAEHPDGTTNAPPALSSDDLKKHGGLSALTVRGESMQPVYNDGDTILMYLDDPMASSPENLIGRDCAVTLSADDASDGTVYLKRLRRSDVGDKGIFNLESINPLWPMMRNQKIIRALPVRYVERL